MSEDRKGETSGNRSPTTVSDGSKDSGKLVYLSSLDLRSSPHLTFAFSLSLGKTGKTPKGKKS